MENQIGQIPVSALAKEDQATFFRKTYAHIALAVLVFIIIESIFLNTPFIVEFALSMASGWTWLLLVGGFLLITNVSQNMARNAVNRNTQYLAMLLFIIAEAIIFVPLIYISIYYSAGAGNIIYQAALMTISLFTGLSAVALLTKKDFSFLKSILTVGFFISLGLIIAGSLFGFNLGLWFSVGMIVLASGSILYQTSNIVHEYREDQYVAAALGLFASLMLLFWYILSILNRD